MTDIQPDYTPFLNLVRPDTHDDIRTTVNKLRDALDAVDAWAAGLGSGAVRTVNASTPKDADGNVAVLVTDGTILVDTTGMDPMADYIGLSLPASPPVGTAIRAIRVSPDDNVSVFFTTGNADPAGYGGTDNSLYRQFEERIAYWPGSGLYGDHSDPGGWSFEGSAAVTLFGLQDFTFSNLAPDGVVPVVAYDGTDGKWKVTSVGRPVVEAAVNYGPAPPGAVVCMDASGGPLFVSLEHRLYSVVTVKKVDSSANTVTVSDAGGAGFINIEGSSSFTLTEPGEIVTMIRGASEWRIIDHVSGPPSLGLDGLSDVVIGTLNDKDLLQFNGTDGKWEDIAPADLGFAAAVGVGHSGSPTTFGDIDLSGALNPVFPAVFLVDATIRADVTLPPAANAFSTDGNQRSAVITFKKIDASANPIHIVPVGSETIDGAAVLDIGTQWESRTLVSDGSNWFEI